METSTDVDSLQKSREILHFNKTEEEFKAMMTGIPEGMLKVTVKWRTTIETCFLYLYLIFSIKNELSLIVENTRGEHLNTLERLQHFTSFTIYSS